MGPASQLVRAGQIGNLAMPHLVLSAAMPCRSVRFLTAVGLTKRTLNQLEITGLEACDRRKETTLLRLCHLSHWSKVTMP